MAAAQQWEAGNTRGNGGGLVALAIVGEHTTHIAHAWAAAERGGVVTSMMERCIDNCRG